MRKILVVEDEPEIQELLGAYLRNEGYDVVLAGDGVQALEVFRGTAVDLVLLDVLLPELDGFGVCREIRRESGVPVIMLTALDGESEQIRGFDLEIEVLRWKGLTVRIESRECLVDGVEIALTQREFDLLAELLRAPGRVLTREVLLSRIWSYDFFGDARIVDSHIKNLRKKLPVDCIETIRGVGYRVRKIN